MTLTIQVPEDHPCPKDLVKINVSQKNYYNLKLKLSKLFRIHRSHWKHVGGRFKSLMAEGAFQNPGEHAECIERQLG